MTKAISQLGNYSTSKARMIVQVDMLRDSFMACIPVCGNGDTLTGFQTWHVSCGNHVATIVHLHLTKHENNFNTQSSDHCLYSVVIAIQLNTQDTVMSSPL